MWLEDDEKVQAKYYLQKNLESSITNLSSRREEIKATVAILEAAVSGSGSGIDRDLREACVQVMEELRYEQESIYRAVQSVERLETGEETAL